MNKIKDTFDSKVINKEVLKQKLNTQIKNYNSNFQYKYKEPKRNSWLKFSLAFVCLMLAIGAIYYYNKDYLLDKELTPTTPEQKIVTAGMNFKSANYNVAILNNSDNYIKEHNILEMVDQNGIAKIDTKEIVTAEEYSKCKGILEIKTSELGEYIYQITSSCENESAENNLTIKKYTNLNNLHLSFIFDLQKIDTGYIGLFGYFEEEDTSCQTTGTTTSCAYYYDTFALVKFDNNGDITDIIKYNKSEHTDKLISAKKIYIENNEYYIWVSEKYENIESNDIIIKYNKDFKIEWTRIIPYHEINFQSLEIIDNKLIIKSNDATLFVLNTEDGKTEKTLEFKIGESTLQHLPNLEYVNGKFYFLTTTPSLGYATNTELPVHTLYIFDNNANHIGSVDLSATQETFEPGHAEFVYYNKENIIVDNQKVLTVYDINGQYLKTIDYSSTVLDAGTFKTERVTYLKNNDFLIINRQNAKYLIEKFNQHGELLQSDIYGLTDEINADIHHGNYYIDDSELINYTYNTKDNGMILMLIFN